jgi:hypothetical protein
MIKDIIAFNPSDEIFFIPILESKADMNRERLDVAIQKIRDYTMNHKELCNAHLAVNDTISEMKARSLTDFVALEHSRMNL